MPSKFGLIVIAPVLVRSVRQAAMQTFDRGAARDAIVGLAFLSTTAWLKLHVGLARLGVHLLPKEVARARGEGSTPAASGTLSKLTIMAELEVWRGETALYLEAAAAAAIRDAEDECRQARARCQAFMTLPQGAEVLEDTDSIAA